MTDAVEELAEHVRSVAGRPLPAEIESAARRVVLDAVGCALAGLTTPEWDAARRMASASTGAREATAFGLDERLLAPAAAFANTVAARAQLYDDTYGPGHLHAGAALTFVALAVAESGGQTLRDVLRAITAGAEVAARVGAAAGEVHYARGFHNTGTCVVFGTAATAAGLLGLDAAATRRALSLAGDHAAGLRRYQHGGSPANSALHAANAADWGIRCATLAGAGFPAPDGMLEGGNGFLATFGAEPDAPATLLAGLGQTWRITEMSIKAFPTCRSTHAPATAIDELRAEYGIDADAVRHVEVTVSRHAFKCDRPSPASALDAQFSIQYVLARLLVYGQLGANDFDSASRADARVQAVQPRVEVRCDDGLLETHARLQVQLTDGRTLGREVRVGEVLGDPGNPLSTDQVRRKFSGNAGSVLAVEPVERLAEHILTAPEGSPIIDLVALGHGARPTATVA